MEGLCKCCIVYYILFIFILGPYVILHLVDDFIYVYNDIR